MVARLASALAPSASFRSPRNGTRPKRHHGWTQVPDLKIPLPYPEPPLTDGVIVLRRWKRTDLSCVEEASHDTRIPEGTTVPSVFTKREGLAWIERQWGRADNGEGLSLAITDAQSDEAVGAVTMTLRPQEGQQRGTAAIGYWIIECARGCRQASRAVALLTRWTLTEAGLARVEALVEPDNIASQRVLEHVGFKREGHLRSYLAFTERRADALIFALLPSDLSSNIANPS
jgi:ribosomal-protein-alanine N-acetyltransferase